MYGYGAPGKIAAVAGGGGTLAVTGVAAGSWFLAGIGMVLVGALLLFAAMRTRRS